MPPDVPGAPFPGFDPTQWLGMMSRALQGPEQALRVYRELLGLEGDSRERSVDFMAQLARGHGIDARLLFEAVVRWGPTDTARVAAAAYLAGQGHEAVVLDALEALQPPLLTLTLISGLLDAIASRPLSPASIERLVAFGRRFDDETHYTTLLLGDFTGRAVKRAVRRALAEGLLRRDAGDAADWPRP